jgi:hypothetical protein
VKLNRTSFYVTQMVLALIVSFFSGIMFPLPAWICIINITEYLKKFGNVIKLVGRPGSIDLGAVIVSGLYLLTCLLISTLLFKMAKFKVFGIAFSICSFIMTIFVFGIVSSIIWF